MIGVGGRAWTHAPPWPSAWAPSGISRSLCQTHPCSSLLAEVCSVSFPVRQLDLAGCTRRACGPLLICARLADRFGRRRIMLWTLIGAILLSLYPLGDLLRFCW